MGRAPGAHPINLKKREASFSVTASSSPSGNGDAGRTRQEPPPTRRAGGPELAAFPTALVAKWLVGLRLVAVSALLIGALLVQSITDELLPITPLVQVAGLTYLLSLAWIGLWLLRCPPRTHGALQLAGDIAILATLIYLTGGLWSPFPFLLLITVGIAALMFGLRGALTAAGGAFVAYAAMAELMAFGVVHPPAFLGPYPRFGPSTLAFQLLVTGTGFALVALLTSYLTHSLQQAEVRLRGERETTARFLALSADVLRSVDSGVLATEVDGRVVLANPAAERILARNDSLVGKAIGDLLVISNFSWEEVLEHTGLTTPIRVDGTLIGGETPLGCTVTPLRSLDGVPLGLVVHFRDLTEVREAARRERLRERMATAGEMAAAIAHEIRNPLASISGSAQVLAKLPALAQNDRKLLRIIVEESHRLSGIVENFLGFARPPEIDRHPCDIARTLEETLTLFANSPEVTKKHHISSDIEPSPRPVSADEQQLRQAFYNLARNAIQAMPTGGTMRVEARPEGDSYVIRWRDDGVGMEPTQLQEIFQPFKAFRRGGTGIGLAIVYSVINEHGGDIGVESTPGAGTVFTLSLPTESA
jgi:two-component system, NtrC family, sensor histidine kinase PilS